MFENDPGDEKVVRSVWIRKWSLRFQLLKGFDVWLPLIEGNRSRLGVYESKRRVKTKFNEST